MAKTTGNLVRMIQAGANLIVDASTKSTQNLIKIAEAASNNGVKITITGATSKTTENLIRIAEAGKGAVTIDER